jgi:coatomer protein complex subunit gamma
MLTESETEFVVRCVRHVLDDHLALQFLVTNTIKDAVLRDLTVHVSVETRVSCCVTVSVRVYT